MEADDPLPDLGALHGTSLVHPDQLDRDTIVGLCRAAALIEVAGRPRGRPLAGSIAITAFFEASTRTRLSFESAVVRLGGGVLSVPDGKVTGVAKGESLADIGEMFTGYGDVVIVRHPDQASVDEICASAGIADPDAVAGLVAGDDSDSAAANRDDILINHLLGVHILSAMVEPVPA